MSIFSGKSDLADYILTRKMYPKYPERENSPLISDEMECFNIFKEETGGRIYQHLELELNETNIDEEIKKVNNPYRLSKKEVPWNDGKNHKIKKYIYTLWGDEYKTLKALNKAKYYAEKEIPFETLLDIIPYYPYIISVMSSGKDGTRIIISSESFVDREYRDSRTYGYENGMTNFYRKKLQGHYVEVVEKYFINREDDNK